MASRIRDFEFDRGGDIAPVDRNYEGLQASFKEALARWPSGVAVVTARSDGLLHGTTVASFTSLSLDPPMVLVCLNASSGLAKVIRESGRFAVSILTEVQEHVSRQFSSPGREASADLYGWADEAGGGDIPGLQGASAVLQCLSDMLIPGGDHLIVTAQVTAAKVNVPSLPLLYYQRRYRSLEASNRWLDRLSERELRLIAGA